MSDAQLAHQARAWSRLAALRSVTDQEMDALRRQLLDELDARHTTAVDLPGLHITRTTYPPHIAVATQATLQEASG